MKPWRVVPMFGIGLILLALAFFLHVYAGMACGIVIIVASLAGFRFSVKKDDGGEG